MKSGRPRPNFGSLVLTIVYFSGMALLFIAERIIGVGAHRNILIGTGTGVLVCAFLWRLRGLRRATPDARIAELALACCYIVGCLAVGLHFSQIGGLISVVWPILWLGSALPLLLLELSYASMIPGENVTAGRIGAAAASGILLTSVLVTVGALNYVAARTERRFDLSYTQESRPTKATRQLVKRLSDRVNVRVFFPSPHEIGDRVKSYLDELRKDSTQLDVSFHDVAVDHEVALDYQADRNGEVVVARGNSRVPITVGTDWKEARNLLPMFDANFQWAINKVSRSRIAYFVVGHGERDEGDDATSGPQAVESPNPGLEGIYGKRAPVLPAHKFTKFHALLKKFGYEIKELSATSGLVTAVPGDATVVFLVGPAAPLTADETAALRRYLDSGGRMFIFVDPDAPEDLEELLSSYQVRFVPQPLLHDSVYFQTTHQLSDKQNLITASFGNHPAVVSLSQSLQRPVFFSRAGHLEHLSVESETSNMPTVHFTVHALEQTWADQDGNFAFDPPQEERRAYELASVVSKSAGSQEMRLLVFADTDIISDAFFESPSNQQLIADGLTYVAMGEPVDVSFGQADPEIRHTRRQDKVWFYSLSFGIPVLVLLVGMLRVRPRRQKP